MTRQIRDDDHVSRYCTRMRIDEDGTPLPAAFTLRRTDEYLSVNWLEYFGVSDIEHNMVHVRKAFGKHYTIRASGQFAVLNVGDVKATIKESLGRVLSITDLQEDDYPSHASIDGYTVNDDHVPIALSEMVEKDDMHPGIV